MDNDLQTFSEVAHEPAIADHWENFCVLMVHQMIRNSHKGFRDKWFSESLDKQLLTLQMSVAELRTAITYGIDVEDKAADVANWAAIIADNWKNNPRSHVGGVPSDETKG